MTWVRLLSRILVGLVFAFSGFVKAIDPWGSAIKFQDYLVSFGMDSVVGLSFFFAILLSTIEFVVGFCLLTGVRMKLASLGALLFMIFFTPLTLYIAIANPVSDCGCFGDAIIMTNWQTFYKNIFIIALAIIVFWQRNKYKPFFTVITEWTITGLGVAISLFLAWYSYANLPIMDFRPYKVGNNISELMTIPEDAPIDEYIYIYNMENSASGEKKDLTSKEYLDTEIWKDTTWSIVNTSDPILVSKGYHPVIDNFSIYSLAQGYDITDDILEDENPVFLLIMYKLDKVGMKNFKKIIDLAEFAIAEGYSFYAVTASVSHEIEQFIEKNNNPPFDFCIGDETTLKTIIRANPGIVLLKKGTVLGKWHHNNTPSPKKIHKKYLKK